MRPYDRDNIKSQKVKAQKVKRPRSPKPRLEAATRPEDGAKGGGAALSRRRRPLKPQRQERRDVREASVAS